MDRIKGARVKKELLKKRKEERFLGKTIG